MSYLELLLVLVVALFVLSPKDLEHCALGLGRLWRWWQSTKATCYAQWLRSSAESESVDSVKHE